MSRLLRMHESGYAETEGGSMHGATDRMRLGIMDRDSGFLQTLMRRLSALSWDHRVLGSAIAPEAIVPLRLNALVLDIALTGENCWPYLEEVCARFPTLAVVVCTGPSSVAQRVRGLTLGVDAWVTKPCHPEELIGVLGAVLRRQRRAGLLPVDGPAVVGELTIRPDRHQAYVRDQSLDLTAREFQILQLLAHTDRVLERSEIYERVWGYAMAHGDRSVDVFVRKLRQKLGAASPRWTYIHTHFGVGYRFSPELVERPPQTPAQHRPPAAPSGAPLVAPLQPVHISITAS